jgi:glycosyltransferase involved in cell wall biosynthesis
VERLQQATPASDTDRRTIITIVNSLSPTSMPLNEFVAWRARRLPEERHVVVSLAPARTSDSSIDLPAEVEIVTGGGDLQSFRRELRATLRRVAASSERAIVHAHHPRSGAIFQTARFGVGNRIPVLFTVHNMFSRYGGATRILSTVNCFRSDHVTFVSHAAFDAFPGALRRLRPGAFSVNPNGVDLDRVDAMLARLSGEEAGRTADRRPFELVNVGKFTLQKGHDFLLDVVLRLPGVRLTLVGDGPERPRIEKRVQEEGLGDRVRFTGVVAREAVYAELLAADLFVSPALWEGLPIAVLEAMALGRPVLLSDIQPHVEIQREHPDLPLFPFDPAAWTEAIERRAGRSAESLRAEGQDNRRTVEAAFTLARMHEGYTEVYDMLNRRGSRLA